MNRHVKDLIIAAIVIAVLGLIALGNHLTGISGGPDLSLEEKLARCSRLERQARNSYGVERDMALSDWDAYGCRNYHQGG